MEPRRSSHMSVEMKEEIQTEKDTYPLYKWIEKENEFVNNIIAIVKPDQEGIIKREQALPYFTNLIATNIDSISEIDYIVHCYGSFFSNTCLKNSYINYTVVLRRNGKFLEIPECKEAYKKISALIRKLEKKDPSIKRIKRLEEYPTVRFYSKNIPIKISFQRYSAYIKYNFLEMVNEKFGKDDIFKKSVILIKAWSLYESHILGVQKNCLSTYSIKIIIIRVISKFNWNLCAMTICGPIPLLDYPQNVIWTKYKNRVTTLRSKSKFCTKYDDIPITFEDVEYYYYEIRKWKMEIQDEVQYSINKYFNIIDPIDNTKNIACTVAKYNIIQILNDMQNNYMIFNEINKLRPEEKLSKYANFFKRILSRKHKKFHS